MRTNDVNITLSSMEKIGIHYNADAGFSLSMESINGDHMIVQLRETEVRLVAQTILSILEIRKDISDNE